MVSARSVVGGTFSLFGANGEWAARLRGGGGGEPLWGLSGGGSPPPGGGGSFFFSPPGGGGGGGGWGSLGGDTNRAGDRISRAFAGSPDELLRFSDGQRVRTTMTLRPIGTGCTIMDDVVETDANDAKMARKTHGKCCAAGL